MDKQVEKKDEENKIRIDTVILLPPKSPKSKAVLFKIILHFYQTHKIVHLL